MKGYIAVTSREWFEFLSMLNPKGEVNFWRKNTRNFKILKNGEFLFFLVKNKKGVKKERFVKGMAVFERYEVNTIEETWREYGVCNGERDKQSLNRRLSDIYNSNELQKIGCIILSNFKVFDRPVLLSELNIDFQNSIVAGKSINEKEIKSIQEAGLKFKMNFNNNDLIIHEEDSNYEIDLTDDNEGFPEGKEVLQQHLIRERDNRVIKKVKNRFLQKHGKLFCEVCYFDFEEFYGELGAGYIEGHHTKPISEMKEGEETKVEDIALVCSNCHRMLHRRRPWLLMDELKKILKKHSK